MSFETIGGGAASRQAEALDALHAARAETLALVADLDQDALDAAPEPGRWSVGEVLDHLVRADEMFLKEVRLLIDKQRRGQTPFLYRGLREIGGPFGSLPLPFRLPIEGSLLFWNAAIPSLLREWVIGQRRFRARAPAGLRPRSGRSRQALLADLEASLEEARSLGSSTDVDLGGAVYYSPVAGFNNIPGLLRLMAQHDRRHQGQIREAMVALAAEAV